MANPAQCPVCDKIIKMSGHLKEHIQSHDDLKLPCNLGKCNGKTFKSNLTMKKHIKTVHEPIFEDCDACGKSINVQLLWHHTKASHSQVTEISKRLSSKRLSSQKQNTAQGSPVTQYHQVILIQVKSAYDEEYESLDITNMPKNVFTLKREILKTLGISLAHAANYRMRRINFDGVFKIKYDHDVMNLKNDNRVELVHESETRNRLGR